MYSRSGSVSTYIVCLMLDEKWLLDAKTWCAVALRPVTCCLETNCSSSVCIVLVIPLAWHFVVLIHICDIYIYTYIYIHIHIYVCIYRRCYCSVAVHVPLCSLHCIQFVYICDMCRYDAVFVVFYVLCRLCDKLAYRQDGWRLVTTI